MLLGQRGEWISPSGATPGSARWVWERWRLRDFTSPEEDQGEALSGVPASARRLRRAAPTIARAVAAAELAALRSQSWSFRPIPSAPATRRRASMARRALARSSSPCGHPPLEKPARLLRAALWAQEERPCRLAAEERLWRRFHSVCHPGLSLDWHLRKKMGEVLRVMDRGITSADSVMSYPVHQRR